MRIHITSYLKDWLLIDLLEHYGECSNFDIKFVWFRILSSSFIGNGNKIHWSLGITLINYYYGHRFQWLFNEEAKLLLKMR